jgi:hypothetical protein
MGRVEGPESSVVCVWEGIRAVGKVEGGESREESRGSIGVLGAGRWSLDARHHLALRGQGLGEAGCAAE